VPVGHPSTWLVKTQSSQAPPLDETERRWRRHPLLAACVRLLAFLAPVAASAFVGILASRQYRPHGWPATIAWAVWTATASLLALWIADIAARRLLPLHRLLQLCLAFPDRAPSRVRIAARAARSRRPEAVVGRADVPESAAEAAELVVTMLGALAIHDRRTRGHSERVCAFAGLLAEQMHLSADERDRITWVALVHDVGKLHVPTRLLNKPGKPTYAEWHVLQAHPERGAAIVEPLREWLGPATDAVLQHHEQYDGRGYPHGVAGDEITPAARLIAVADAFEVMTAPRAYRRPVDAQSARAELARHAGEQFDPQVVRAFLAIGLPKLRRAMGPLAWLAQLPFVSSWPRLEAATSHTAAQAATATAAASTAGLLALAGGTVTVAQAVSTPPAFAGPDATWAPTAPTAVDAVASASAAEAPVTGHTVAVAAVDLTTTVPPRTTAAPKRATRKTRSRAAHADAIRAFPRPSAQVDAVQSETDQGEGHAYGHAHAPGWQKNWGPGGRQVEKRRGRGNH
jgi:hypothetical protein